MSSFLDPEHLVNTFGLIGLVVILFAECGLLVGFFLPGDSLLFTAGLLVASQVFTVPLWVLLVVLPLAAIAGNLVGYWIGRRVGPAVFSRPDSRLFKAEYVHKSQAFFDRNGNRTILLARFVPIVRTFATVMAGASLMDFRRYAVWSVIGGVLWAGGVTALGYWLGQVAVVRAHVELFILGIVALSLVPVVVEVVRSRQGRAA
ncbi:membrane-associated protein [Klenkia marina]|uniref:Membrane-associated protein n=1 Tax=Klenkia marina TaxID=1960309 RepID=A0A1G4XWE1_9ACTN|nr:VTT domain-containing protein [Klenkia marina]SCX45485.1 membrane-associated protein [Klenkia marina]